MSADRATDGVLARILAGRESAFALLYRPGATASDTVDVVAGEVSLPASLADISLRENPEPGGPAHDAVVLVPYRQLTERGFAAPDDGAPLISLTVTRQSVMPVPELLAQLPAVPTPLSKGRFDVTDEKYAESVRRIVSDEIGTGEGANFVLRRTFVADIDNYSLSSAFSLFRRLLLRERGTYWTFLVHTPHRTLIGASPERHVSVRDGTAVMNPVSGTYRYPSTGPTLQGVKDFLADPKERDELYMVLDEELKMMGRICEGGGRVIGPFLKEMAHLAHTEYLIEGRTTRDVREVLRETLFAPTVTGSPLESAARVIQRYEPEGRGFYSGVATLIGHDRAGERELDSAILIRTADIAADGQVRIPVGATLVRHSDPASEVAETRAKAAGLIAALESKEADAGFGEHPEVRAALLSRNRSLSGFWLGDTAGSAEHAELAGISALVIDAEDTFTAMLDHQLRTLGVSVDVRRFDEPYDWGAQDVVVLGPGPGDPLEEDDPKIGHLRSAVDTLLRRGVPFVAVCLSHQVLSGRLGFPLVRRTPPNQGVQRTIDLFGRVEQVGFYNTFAAVSKHDKGDVPGVGAVTVSRDPETDEIHALRGPGFASMQFHAESVLTVDGPRIIATAIREAMGL